MKKAISLAILLVLLISALPLVQVMAGSPFVPHQDPGAADSEHHFALPMLQHYSGVLSLVADARYRDAGELMDELDIDKAAIPEDIRTVARRYNNLISELAGKLDRLDALLDAIRFYLDEERVDEARTSLNEARESSSDAKSLLEEVDEASREFMRRLGPFAGAVPTGSLEETGERLSESLQRIKDLEAMLAALLAELEAEVQKPTTVTLESDHPQREVGGELTLSGILTWADEDTPLAGKQVVIRRDGQKVKTVTTGSDGTYSTTWTVPFIYMPVMELQATYSPEGADRDRYDGSASDVLHLEVLYETTQIISAGVDNATPWPDDTITVEGRLVLTADPAAGLAGEDIRILLDGVLMDTVVTGADGYFSAALAVPRVYQPSPVLEAEFAPAAGINGPSSAETPLSVQFEPTSLTLLVSHTGVWVGDSVTVAGKLSSGDDLFAGGASRTVQILKDGAVVATAAVDENGNFNREIIMAGSGNSTLQARYEYAKDKFAPSTSPSRRVEVKLYPSELTLEAGQSRLWVGEQLTLSGMLTSTEEGTGVAGALIEIVSGETVLAAFDTGPDGGYSGEVTVPYIYHSSQDFEARFVPEGSLEERYEGSSAQVQIETVFYSTGLDLTVPGTGYPGLPLPVQGEVSYAAGVPVIERTYSVYLDGELALTFAGRDGLDTELDISSFSHLGPHTVKVVVEAAGVYSDISVSREVEITRLPMEIHLKGTYVTSPPRELRVTGTLVSELPLHRALVEVVFRGETMLAVSAEDGHFEAVFDLPLDAVPLGSHEIEVRARPVESWHEVTELKTTVFVVDVVNLVLVTLAFISVGIVVYTRRRSRREMESAGYLGGWRGPDTVLPPPSESTPVPDAPGLQVLDIYGRTVRLIESRLGIRMTPETTLREFLKVAVLQRQDLAAPLTGLTSLAEQALYSEQPSVEDVSGEAGRLSGEIRGVLES